MNCQYKDQSIAAFSIGCNIPSNHGCPTFLENSFTACLTNNYPVWKHFKFKNFCFSAWSNYMITSICTSCSHQFLTAMQSTQQLNSQNCLLENVAGPPYYLFSFTNPTLANSSAQRVLQLSRKINYTHRV